MASTSLKGATTSTQRGKLGSRRRGPNSTLRALHSSDEEPSPSSAPFDVDRRSVLLTAAVAVPLTQAAGSAQASKLGAVGDSIWENAFGGGPPDLFYPDEWEGTWLASSTLTKVDLPLGPEMIPNISSVNRAMSDDLNKTIQYPVRFIRNGQGRVISDRVFNTAALVQLYTGKIEGMRNRLDWDKDDPNILSMRLPGGLTIRTRVTRRSEEEMPERRRIETSEFFEQVFDDPNTLQPRVKASQCFTKYVWRSVEEAKGGPQIIATQVVSDYLTAMDSIGIKDQIMNANKPITIYTYKMSFSRAPDGTEVL